MTRLILLGIYLFLGYALYSFIRQLFGPSQKRPPHGPRSEEEMVQDPQCGTYLPRSEALSKTVKGEKYYFCSRECRDAFVRKS